MKVTLLTVGKTDKSYLREGMMMYQQRLTHYITFSFVEIPDIKGGAALSRDMIRRKEGEVILKALKPSDAVILLDERGRQYSSEQWAAAIEERISRDSRDIVFIIGGPYGFSDEVYARAEGMMSLSKMTFSHQMVRLIFLEQLYRAFTIIKGEPYHHK